MDSFCVSEQPTAGFRWSLQQIGPIGVQRDETARYHHRATKHRRNTERGMGSSEKDQPSVSSCDRRAWASR